MIKLTEREACVLDAEAQKHIDIASHCEANACKRDHMEIAAAISRALHILKKDGRVETCEKSKWGILTALHRLLF